MGLSVINWGGVTNSNLSESSKYPLQTSVATKEFQRIESLRASTSNYGMTKLSDATDITDADIYALSAIENNPNIDNTLANQLSILQHNQYDYYNSFIYYNAGYVGWVRLHKYRHSGRVASYGLDLDIYVGRGFTYGAEMHYIKCYGAYNTIKFKQINGVAELFHYITKVRFCHDSDYGYVDIYISTSTNETLFITIVKNIQETRTTFIDNAYHVNESVNGESVDCIINTSIN